MSVPNLDEAAQINAILRRASDAPKGFELLGLGLQNFQAIQEAQFFPLAPLTLVYGPNSSGKSSISDAFTIFGFVASDATASLNDMLKHWANQSNVNKDPKRLQFLIDSDTTAFWIALAPNADNLMVGEHHGLHEQQQIKLRKLLRTHPVALRLTFVSGQYGFEYTSAAVWVGSDHGRPLFEFKGQTNWEPVSDGPAVDDVSIEPIRRCACVVDLAHPLAALLDEAMQILEWPGAAIDRAATLSVNGTSRIIQVETVEWLGYSVRDIRIAETNHRELETYLFVACQALLGHLIEDVGEAASVRSVPPIRHVPLERDSTFVISSPVERGARAPKFDDGVEDGERDPWNELARSACGKWFPDESRFQLGRREHRERCGGKDLFDYVHRAIQEEALLGLHYDLVAARYEYQSDEVSSTAAGPTRRKRAPTGEIIRLYLHDDLGAQVALEHVGTGVSQLIPVLVALMSRRNVYVHQPELHLHPRVQSALGDVFIERLPFRASWVTLIESHSEHILLRILRRIRDTTRGSLGTERSAIQAKDLCVLYFDRQPDASTRVKHLRVNEKGEFLDRWPTGFFTERDEDLDAFLV